MTEPARSDSAPEAEPSAASLFEFSDDHKEVLRRLASALIFAGVSLVLFGGFGALLVAGAELYAGSSASALAAAVAAGVVGALSWWILSAGRVLSAIVTTRGRSVELLLASTISLRRFFWCLGLLVVAAALSGTAVIAVSALRP
jgi:hypothetical protein